MIMQIKNKQLTSRMLFLGAFILTVVAIFYMGKSLSNSQNQEPAGQIVQDFVPKEAGIATLVEFSDFQCPACRLYYPIVKQLKAEFGDKLQFTYKYFPLQSIHKNANISAQAGEAARSQGKFDQMEEALFTKQDAWANEKDAKSIFVSYAGEAGLNVDQFKADIESGKVKDKVQEDYQYGVGLGIRGTPTFFLNGKKLSNPTSYEDFKSIVEEVLKQ